MGDEQAKDVLGNDLPAAGPTNAEKSSESPRSGEPERIEPSSPASQPFPRPSGTADMPEGSAGPRRSSIRPAPSSFKPTLRQNHQVSPMMVVHSGEGDESASQWDESALGGRTAPIELEQPASSEPFGIAEDLREKKRPLSLPPPPPVPSEHPPAYHRQQLPSFSLEETALAERLPAVKGEPVSAPAPSLVDAEAPTQVRSERPSAADTDVDAACAPVSQKTDEGSGSSSTTTSVDTAIVPSPSDATLAQPREPAASVVSQVRTVDAVTHRALLSRRGLLAATGLAALVLGVVAFVGLRGKPSPASGANAEPSAATSVIVSAVLSAAPVAAASSAAPVLATAEPATEAAPAARSDVNLVTLNVKQSDVKVVFHGVAISGPPYLVEVPKGKRVSVEVSKKGYATRKVVLDGRKSTETVGLLATKATTTKATTTKATTTKATTTKATTTKATTTKATTTKATTTKATTTKPMIRR